MVKKQSFVTVRKATSITDDDCMVSATNPIVSEHINGGQSCKCMIAV